MRWQEKSVSFEELASVPAPNTFINRQRDRTFGIHQEILQRVHDGLLQKDCCSKLLNLVQGNRVQNKVINLKKPALSIKHLTRQSLVEAEGGQGARRTES